MTKTTDWRDYTERMIALLQRLGAAHYIKRDLQPYLPAGYHNPLRVPQWHTDFRNASPLRKSRTRMGRPPIGSIAMTSAQRQRRYRDKLRRERLTSGDTD